MYLIKIPLIQIRGIPKINQIVVLRRTASLTANYNSVKNPNNVRKLSDEMMRENYVRK